MTDKLDMASPDMVSKNIEMIADLFPNCITETAEGKAIDFDLLKQELSHEIIEGTKERYRLEWPGKKEAIVTANLPTTKTLRPVRKDSVDFDTTENLYIEGDNLEVLKLLQESYLGKIKMIYIDPPYNTGNDFVYRDNFSQDTQEFKEDSGQVDEYSQRLIANPDTSGRYHSDWLTMMYPRLKLARNLLADDGLIFISIGDDEVHNLRKICDEVFGETGFSASFIWKRRQIVDSRSKTGVSTDHEYCLVYKKNNNVRIRGGEKDLNKYANPDNDPRGPWMSDNMVGLATKDQRPNLHYDLVNPSTNIKYDCPPTGWRYEPKRMKELISNGEVLFPAKEDGRPRRKKFLKDLNEDFTGFSTMLKTVYNTQGTRELRTLFDEHEYFDFPKPTDLIKIFIEQGVEKDSIILDFFSGSATTAHATMQLNAEDTGSRKYIMVQLPEAIDENTEAKRAGYNNICEIGKDRIRRAAKKIKAETNAVIDYGFRVYRLDESNMQDVYYRPQDYKQDNLELFADNVKHDRTGDDLLAQVMLDWGLPLSLKIEQLKISGKQVFKVAENSLMACFDKGIDEAFAKEIAGHKPMRVVFRDASFKDDTAKENVKQLLKQLSPETEMRVI
ncbi:MAG: site-specific DNA-methyltransferase [Bacteroidetes bacterium]|nr:site-specific DNA-methyltransferase [Bacteroidota bacterium]